MWIASPVGISAVWPGCQHQRRVERRRAGRGRRCRAWRRPASASAMRASSTLTSIGSCGASSAPARCARRSRAPARAPASAWRPRGSSRSPSASTSSSVLSSRPKVAGPRLPTISGTPLRTRLSRACLTRSWLSAAKPTHQGRWRRRQRGHRGQDVGVLGQLAAAARVFLPSFLILCVVRRCRPPVGHRGGGDEDVVRRRQRQHRVVHLLRAGARRCAARGAAWPGAPGRPPG